MAAAQRLVAVSQVVHRVALDTSQLANPPSGELLQKEAASWFLQCFSLSFVSSEDLGGIASLVLPRAQEALGCKWQQKGMNRGMNRV